MKLKTETYYVLYDPEDDMYLTSSGERGSCWMAYFKAAKLFSSYSFVSKVRENIIRSGSHNFPARAKRSKIRKVTVE